MKKLTTKKFIEELEGTIDIKARKNYFIVEEKGNKIRIIDQKGNDIFTFEGSFCWNPKETVLICNDNWVITKKNEYGYYYLYDCINKTIVEIKNNKVRPLKDNAYGIYSENDNFVKVFNKKYVGVYEIQVEKGKNEALKELIPVEYQKIETFSKYIMAQKETGEIAYYDYDGKVLMMV